VNYFVYSLIHYIFFRLTVKFLLYRARVRLLVGGKYIFRLGETLSTHMGMGLNGVHDFTRGMYMVTGSMKITAV